MKVNSGLVSAVGDTSRAGAGFFHFRKGPFPAAGGKGLFREGAGDCKDQTPTCCFWLLPPFIEFF